MTTKNIKGKNEKVDKANKIGSLSIEEKESEYPFVLGTAGHIDHGKTTLVQVISGVDCDRLTSEKKRGITIELGFAPLKLPSGKIISIVDVPGHEKFIRQMVSGAAGLDAVMLVIAADDGVMSQTREHLEILTLLGLQTGLIVISKVDLVEEEFLQIVKEEVAELVKGTFLENAPIIPFSSHSKYGMDNLLQNIDKIVKKTPKKTIESSFYLPIDRAFHISGFGTVITGTLLKGRIKEGQTIQILPVKIESKARSIQVHDKTVKEATAGQRVAINLSNISLDDIAPGDVLTSENSYFSTNCLDIQISVLDSALEPIKHWERLHLHVGTSDILARISLLDRKEILPGETTIAQLILEKNTSVFLRMPFILRKYSPMITVAGGKVLSTQAIRPKNKKAKIKLIKYLHTISANISLRESIRELVEYRETLAVDQLSKFIEKDVMEYRGQLSALEMKNEIALIRVDNGILVSKTKMQELNKLLQNILAEFHSQNSALSGMPIDKAANLLDNKAPRYAKNIIQQFVKQGRLKLCDDKISLLDFKPFDESDFIATANKVKTKMLLSEYSFLTVDELSDILSLQQKEVAKIISYLKEKKEIISIGQNFLLPKEIFFDFLEKIQTIEGSLTLGKARDLTQSSRKYILPLLEYFDSIGITRRIEDKRIILKKANDFR